MPDNTHINVVVRIDEGRFADGYTHSRGCLATFVAGATVADTIYVESNTPGVYVMWCPVKAVLRRRTERQ